VVLFLDNDPAGKEAKEGLKKSGIQFLDASHYYATFKDLNDYLKSEARQEKDIRHHQKKNRFRI
jgi:hypothetical protein